MGRDTCVLRTYISIGMLILCTCSYSVHVTGDNYCPCHIIEFDQATYMVVCNTALCSYVCSCIHVYVYLCIYTCISTLEPIQCVCQCWVGSVSPIGDISVPNKIVVFQGDVR